MGTLGTFSPSPIAGGHVALPPAWLSLASFPHRHSCLERILPAAQRFQESVDSFQEWLSATERCLAQLWHANGCVSHLQAAHQQSQVRAGGWVYRAGLAGTCSRPCSMAEGRDRYQGRGP